MKEYEVPQPRISWDRRVEGEEQHNNTINLMEARRALDTAAARIAATGTPETFYYDDLDTDRPVGVPIGWDMIQVIDIALNREAQYLAKQGIIFDVSDNQQPR